MPLAIKGEKKNKERERVSEMEGLKKYMASTPSEYIKPTDRCMVCNNNDPEKDNITSELNLNECEC